MPPLMLSSSVLKCPMRNELASPSDVLYTYENHHTARGLGQVPRQRRHRQALAVSHDGAHFKGFFARDTELDLDFFYPCSQSVKSCSHAKSKNFADIILVWPLMQKRWSPSWPPPPPPRPSANTCLSSVPARGGGW